MIYVNPFIYNLCKFPSYCLRWQDFVFTEIFCLIDRISVTFKISIPKSHLKNCDHPQDELYVKDFIMILKLMTSTLSKFTDASLRTFHRFSEIESFCHVFTTENLLI